MLRTTARAGVDGQRCALRDCALGVEISSSQDACRVTTPVERVRTLSRTAARECCCVDWDASSQRTHFHAACWALLAGAAAAPRFRPAFRRRRGEAGAESAPTQTLSLSDAERALVDQVADTCERFSTHLAVLAQAKLLAQLLRERKHTVAFTGAGVSVSAGIPDYRGTAGVDTVAAHGSADRGPDTSPVAATCAEGEDAEAIAASASYLRLQPTKCHRALAALSRAGMLSCVITQNCDDLHARSGIPPDQVIELHGNVFIEFCERCETEYRRPYCVDLFSTDCTAEPWFVRCRDCRHGHYTGRECACGGKLRDSIVNFGDDLHKKVLGGGLPAAESQCSRAQLILALGCSMSVSPARDLPRLRRDPDAKLVLVNLQATEADGDAQLRVFYPCDDFFDLVMRELRIEC